jgi:hypothetical protein
MSLPGCKTKHSSASHQTYNRDISVNTERCPNGCERNGKEQLVFCCRKKLKDGYVHILAAALYCKRCATTPIQYQAKSATVQNSKMEKKYGLQFPHSFKNEAHFRDRDNRVNSPADTTMMAHLQRLLMPPLAASTPLPSLLPVPYLSGTCRCLRTGLPLRKRQGQRMGCTGRAVDRDRHVTH